MFITDGQSIVWTDGDPDKMGTAMRYIVDAYPAEPLLCIRGRDRLAILAVSAYRELVIEGVRNGVIGGTVADAVTRDLRALGEWQALNVPRLKYPDR